MSKIIDLNYATTTPCRELKTLPQEDKERIADLIVDHYRKVGFPHYCLSDDQKKDIALKMLHFTSGSLLLENNELQQVMLGLNLANCYHPQMWTVEVSGHMSPMRVFENDAFFKRSILKRIDLCNTKLQPFNIRKSVMVFGAHRVSNFRPTVAKFIYDHYCPEQGSVLDPCAGYGGRMLGAWASHTVFSYTGVDPDNRQVEGIAAMSTDLGRVSPRIDTHLKNVPFEDFKGIEKSYDLVFTSPPYFDNEIYAYEKTQSWLRYRTYDKWVSKFLYPLIFKSHFFLKKGGALALNVGKPIHNDAVRIATEMFGQPEAVYQMRLSRVLGSRNPNKFKYEPIYIWRK